MKTLRLVILAFILLLGYSCEKTKDEEPEPTEINLTQKWKILADWDIRVEKKFFKEVLKTEEPEGCSWTLNKIYSYLRLSAVLIFAVR